MVEMDNNSEKPEKAATKPITSLSPKPIERMDTSSPLSVGRPTKFSWLLVKDICIRIQKGEFLTDILNQPNMPDTETFRHWMEKKRKIAEWVERSRRIAAEVLAEKSVTLFFDKPETEVLQTKHGSYERISMAGVQRERYKSQAMQWLAGKWGSEVYGEKMQVNNSFDVSVILNRIDTPKKMKTIEPHD